MSKSQSLANKVDNNQKSEYSGDPDGINISYRMHLSSQRFSTSSSSSSTSSIDSDLSFSLLADHDLNAAISAHTINADEMPAFEIRLISPLGRTPSPIDSESAIDDSLQNSPYMQRITTTSYEGDDANYMTLQEINAHISLPSDSEDGISRNSSLETIYEGVFLRTPPRQSRSRLSRHATGHTRTNLLEKVALNRLLLAERELQSTTAPSSVGQLLPSLADGGQQQSESGDLSQMEYLDVGVGAYSVQ